MLRAMFGMGGTEILVILIVALLFLGPDKLPEAAKKISKGIRDIKKQSRVLQRTIEDDEHIGGAIRDLKSALRGEDEPVRPKPIKPPKQLVEPETPALPEPGNAEHLGEHAGEQGALVAATGSTASSSGEPEPVMGAPEPTLRGVLAPTGSSEPTSSTSAGAHEPTPAAPPEPTLRGVIAPEPPADEPRLTMPPTAGDPDDAAPATSARDDAELAQLVKPAPHTIPRSSSPSPAAPSTEPLDKPELKHG
jgi:sec-independent protein translocase protein TatB